MNIRKLIILFLFVGLSACEQDVLYNSNLSNANTPKSKLTDESEKYFIEKIGGP